MDPVAVLARCPLFAELPDAEIAALATIAVPRHYRAGETLFLAGEHPEGLHVVVRGRVRIHVVSPESGRPLVLTSETPHHAVAELPSFDGGAYPAHGDAEEPTETVLLPQDLLDDLLERRPALARHMLRTLGRRLRSLVALIESLSFQEVVQRLAALLLRQADTSGLPFELPTNADLAAELGTVPELASRNLSRLARQGAITLQGRSVAAVRREVLEDLALSARR